MDPVIIAALITAVGTVVGAVVGATYGKKQGYKSGFEEGKKHSIEKFMDVYRDDIDRAVDYLEKDELQKAKNVARGLVENVKIWREIQERFWDLLNGLIRQLEGALNEDNDELATQTIHTIREAYRGKRLAIETELKKSQI